MAAPVSTGATRHPPTSEQKSAEVSSSLLRKKRGHFPCLEGTSNGGLREHSASFAIRAPQVPATPSPLSPRGRGKSRRTQARSSKSRRTRAPAPQLLNGLYLIRCGFAASSPSLRRLSASYSP